jgi:DNA polymerase III subunit epsilon
MKLNLKKPLAFFDLETTGTDVGRDRIVEIAIVKVMPDGQINTLPIAGTENRLLINPQMPISIESSLIHGIYEEHIKTAPTFKEVAPRLFKFLFDCDLAGFNSNKFDIPLLAEEFLRAEIDFTVEGRNQIDVQVLFHMMEPRNLKAAYQFYCNKNLNGAHEALPDTVATYEVLVAMLDKYDGVEVEDSKGNVTIPVVNDMDLIHKLCERRKKADLASHLMINDQDQVVFNFGKYKNKAVVEVFQSDPGYFSWMMNAEFPLYTKKVLKEIREKMKST